MSDFYEISNLIKWKTNYEIKNNTIWMEITLYRWDKNKNSMIDKGGSDNSQHFVDFFPQNQIFYLCTCAKT